MGDRDRIARTGARATTMTGQRSSAAAPSALLRLQRTAGNAAVTRLLARRTLPTDPTSLGDYKDLRGEISIDSDQVDVKKWRDLFKPKGARFTPRDGVDVDFHFSKNIALDKSKEDVIEIGLSGMARAALNLTSTSTDAVKKGATVFLDLDLTDFGGRDGRYRFTCVAGSKAGEVQVLIEFTGPSRTPLKTWDALGKAGQTALTERFTRFGFTWGDGDVGWANDKQAQVMQALALIPDAVLNEVSGISWERARAPEGASGEAGDYNAGKRRIRLYTSAFDSDWGLIELVAHELGHGLDFRPQERKHSDPARDSASGYRTAAGGALGKAPTAYGRTAWKEDFAEGFAMFIEEPDTLKLLRPDLFDYFEKLVGSLPKPN